MPVDSQSECQAAAIGLPAPKWCFVLLGMPTFYMPLAYLLMAGWVFFWTVNGEDGDLPKLLWQALVAAYYVTFAMLPIYLAWVALSKRLTLREKAQWLLVVILMNMAGMPIFYVFMIRRYLGMERRTTKQDAAALERFLKKHAIARDWLSGEQLNLLLAYCRRCRLAKWETAPMVMAAALMLYVAVFIPTRALPLCSDFLAADNTVVDSAPAMQWQRAAEPEALQSLAGSLMLLGAMAGMLGAMSFLILTAALCPWRGAYHRKTLIDFLRATQRSHRTNPSA